MLKQVSLFNKEWKVNLLLLVISFGIYFFYYQHIFFNINSLLSSITGDSLKNYYTFVYHIKNDPGLLHFSGMNYPFGEHIVYTDCQPGLTFILRLLPFTHNYLVGILHMLIFLSFIISPVILNKVCNRLGIYGLPAIFISLGIGLLSPQFFRIYAGHYALAYACVLPICILLTVNYLKEHSNKNIARLFTYNTAMFLIHPYLAFGLCVFCCLTIFVFEFPGFNRRSFFKGLKALAITGMLPVLLFKIFMVLTDQHINRTAEPYGLNTSLCTPGNIFTPVAGPFKTLLESIFHVQSGDFEGFCYLGAMVILMLFVFIICIPFTIKNLQLKKEVSALFIASVILLLFSLGLHLKIFDLLNIKSESLNQFRALGRFSWFFYYMLPLFLFAVFYHSLKKYVSEKKLHYIFGGLAFVFFISNFAEIRSIFIMYRSGGFWEARNVFNEDLLTADEKQVIAKTKAMQAQAIIPLPTFYIGSEVYDREVNSSNHPLIPSLIYSYYTGLPLISGMMSRTSLNETEEGVNILNAYKKNKAATALMTEQPLMVMKTNLPLMPDEERLWQKTKLFKRTDTLEFGYITKADLLNPVMDQHVVSIKATPVQHYDSSGVIFLNQNTKPFLLSGDGEYETILKIDSNNVIPGSYYVSLHYYYKRGTWKDVLCHLIVNKSKAGLSEWPYFLPIRAFSGFYKDYAVFENRIELEKDYTYQFVIKSGYIHDYKISDFLLRPVGTSVKVIKGKQDTVYNNYPAY